MDDKNKYSQNLKSLVDTILELVPEAYDQRDEIFALIKTHMHSEKHFLWKDLSHWLKEDNVAWVYDRIINPKIETHGKEGWGDFDKNLEWVREHHPLPNSIKFIKG